jgi:hypothetical protein
MSDLAEHLHNKDLSFRNAQKLLGASPWTAPLSEPVPSWLVPGLLQRAALHVLTSESGACKSWLGLGLMLAGIYGIPVLGQRPEATFSSIYLAADSPSWDIGQQLRKLMLAHSLKQDEHPTSFVLPLGFLFDNRDHLVALADLVNHWDIDALFIDVMLYTHNQNENDNGAMARTVLRAAKYLRDEWGLAIFFLHHNSKPRPDMPDTFRGAGTIVQAAEHHFALAPHAQNIDLTVKKIRGDKVLPPLLSFRLSQRNGGHFLERLVMEPLKDDDGALLVFLGHLPATRGAINLWFAQNLGLTEKQVDNKLQYLRSKNLIQSDGKGTWTACKSQSATSSPS